MKKLAKKILSYFSYPLFQVKLSVLKFPNNKDYFYSIMLHNLPKDDFKHCKKLLFDLKKEFGFIDPNSIGTEDFTFNDLEKKRKKILLTFDDGFISNYYVAKEILDPLDIKAIFFIPTGFINSKTSKESVNFIKNKLYGGIIPDNLILEDQKPMSWENIIELKETGHTIGSHTINHYRLSKITDKELLKKEIIESGDDLSKKINKNIDHFAYPFGDITSINKNALKIAKDRYKFIYTGIRGVNNFDLDIWKVHRESIDVTQKINYNKFIVTGGLSFFYLSARNKFNKLISSKD